MATSITDFLGIDKQKFNEYGAFDAILNVDSRFFIDPHLLKDCKIPDFQNSYSKVEKRFRDILLVLKHSKNEGDIFWKNAEKFFEFPEIKGLCIGYSNKGTSGSAIGPGLRSRLLHTAKSIMEAGIVEPEIFELVGLFESNIGPDRISDVVANIIYEDILKYTENMWDIFNISTKNIKYREEVYKMVVNPFNNAPILLLPKDLLKDLPIAFDWSDIDRVCAHNEELRNKVNNIIGYTWKQATSGKKQILREAVLDEPELMRDLITLYRAKPFGKYDFENDRSGQIAWYEVSKKFTRDFPLQIDKRLTNEEGFLDFILLICEKYKDLIENNGLSSLLYEANEKPKKEEAAQKLFYGIADAYCEANNIDISREVNGGRGPVDFKFSKGYKKRVVVEAKLTTNNQLLHGFEKQIQEYQKAEKTKEAIYLIIDIGGSRQRLQNLKSLEATNKQKGLKMPAVFYIDGKRKPSASVY